MKMNVPQRQRQRRRQQVCKQQSVDDETQTGSVSRHWRPRTNIKPCTFFKVARIENNSNATSTYTTTKTSDCENVLQTRLYIRFRYLSDKKTLCAPDSLSPVVDNAENESRLRVYSTTSNNRKMSFKSRKHLVIFSQKDTQQSVR